MERRTLALRLRLGAILAFAGLAAACATPRPPDHPLVVAHKDGQPLGPDMTILDDDAFRKHVQQNILRRIDTCLARAARDGLVPEVVVYVHGGLTTYKASFDHIESVVEPETGRLKGTNLCPLFVVWDSSLWDTLRDDLVEVRFGSRTKGFWWRVVGYLGTPFVVAQRLANSLLSLPATLVYQGDYTVWEPLVEVLEPVPVDEQVSAWTRLLITAPTKVATAPVIGGFGTGAWNMMKRRIEQMFFVSEQGGELRKGALRIFFEELQTRIPAEGRWKAEAEQVEPSDVTLVGHSMGAIVVTRILAEFRKVEFRRVVYLASAASVDDFRTSIVPYLADHPGVRFYSFSLAQRDEATEANFGDLPPRGSLLIWIDNMFEPGLWPNQRRVGWWRNVLHIRLQPNFCDRITFVKLRGTASDPRQHAAFNEDGKLQSLLEFAANPWKSCSCATAWDVCQVEIGLDDRPR